MNRSKHAIWNRGNLKQFAFIYILLAIPILSLLVYYIAPMFLQFILVFKEYSILGGIFGSPWVGFENIETLVHSPDFVRIVTNTIRISLLRLLVEFLPPIILAVMLFDMSHPRIRSVSQSILYIPYFFSWAVVYFIVYSMFSSDGFINQINQRLFGGTINYMVEEKYFYPLLLGSSLWKNIGWNTIVYLAALSNINPELFEAAKLDGAGPLQRTVHITIPGIAPVIVFLLTLALGRITANEGTEQLLLFYSPATYSLGDTIGTWVYRKGLGDFKYSLGAAVSLLNALIGLALVLIFNKISTKYLGVGIW